MRPPGEAMGEVSHHALFHLHIPIGLDEQWLRTFDGVPPCQKVGLLAVEGQIAIGEHPRLVQVQIILVNIVESAVAVVLESSQVHVII